MKTNKAPYILILVLSVIFAGIAKVLNGGWLLILLIFLAPLYIALFCVSNGITIAYIHKSTFLKINFFISCITLIMTAVLMPDADDIKEYAVFTLIKDKNIINILFSITGYLIEINFITIIIGFFSKLIAGDNNKKIDKNNLNIKN